MPSATRGSPSVSDQGGGVPAHRTLLLERARGRRWGWAVAVALPGIWALASLWWRPRGPAATVDALACVGNDLLVGHRERV